MDTLTLIATLLSGLGGYELVKYLLNRRSNGRVARAKAETEEFHALREYNEFLQKQLLSSDERCIAQSERVRTLTDEILELTRTQAELTLRRCERRGCADRQPQNGF